MVLAIPDKGNSVTASFTEVMGNGEARAIDLVIEKTTMHPASAVILTSLASVIGEPAACE